MLNTFINSIGMASLLLAPLGAVATPIGGESTPTSPPIGIPGVLGFGVSLILVIAAILLVGWIYSQTKGMRDSRSSVISVLASQSLGSKEKIVLVGVGDKQIVVGVTAVHLQTLHVFDQPIVNIEAPAKTSVFAERLLTTIKGMRP